MDPFLYFFRPSPWNSIHSVLYDFFEYNKQWKEEVKSVSFLRAIFFTFILILFCNILRVAKELASTAIWYCEQKLTMFYERNPLNILKGFTKKKLKNNLPEGPSGTKDRLSWDSNNSKFRNAIKYQN